MVLLMAPILTHVAASLRDADSSRLGETRLRVEKQSIVGQRSFHVSAKNEAQRLVDLVVFRPALVSGNALAAGSGVVPAASAFWVLRVLECSDLSELSFSIRLEESGELRKRAHSDRKLSALPVTVQ